MAKITTVEHVQMLKNYVDDKTDEGFKIDGDNLTFREGNEIIISGLKNENGEVEGVEISNGKIILSPNVLGFSDITLQKATGAFRGSQFELIESHFSNTSILSAQNDNLEYHAAYNLDYTLADSDTKIIYTGTGKPSFTILGAGNDVDTSGVDIQSKDVTVSAVAIDDKNVTINATEGFNFKFDGTNTITNAATTAKISVSSGSVKNSVSDVTIYGANFDASISNTPINLNGTSDTVTISGGTNSSYYGGVGSHFIEKDFLINHNAYIFNAGDGNTTIKNLSFYDSLIVDGTRIEEWDNGTVANGDNTISIIIDNPHLAIIKSAGGGLDGEAYTATSSNEEITLSASAAKSKKSSSTTTTTLRPKTKNAPLAGVNAGAGNDTITVSSGVAGMSIYGGRGNELIYNYGDGNIFIYELGDGKDSIYGWDSDKDLLVMTSAYTTAMSADGNQLLVKIGSGYFAFCDVAYGDKVKVLGLGEQSSFHYHEVKKLMQGTASSESISNTDTTLDATHIHRGNSSSDYWVIDAGNGNDSITNIFDYVSINGGEGNDKIYIQSCDKNISTVTTGVTIQSGVGNDTIDVSADTIESNGVTLYGGHVYEFGTDDGYNSIIGFNGNDTLVFDSQVTNLSADINVSGQFVIQADNTRITLIKPEDKELYGTRLNIKVKNNLGNISDLSSDTFITFATPIYSGTSISHYEIPKKILKSNSAETTLNYSSDYDNYTVDAAGGNDRITISGSAMSINGGAGLDRILILSSNNTIVGGTGNDYIANFGNNQVYEFGESDGTDYILNFTGNSTIKAIYDNSTINSQEITSDGVKLRFSNTYVIIKGALIEDNLPAQPATPLNTEDEISVAEWDAYNSAYNDYIFDSYNYRMIPDNPTIFIETSNGTTTFNAPQSFYVNGTFDNTVDNCLLECSASDNTISNTANNVSVYAIKGNNTITNYGNNVTINANLNTIIEDFGSDTTINRVNLYHGTNGNDTINNSTSYVSIIAGYGDDSIYNTGNNVSIYSGYDNATITNTGNYVSIRGYDSNNTISNEGISVTIYGSSAGDDSITNAGDNALIYTSNGNDTIINTGKTINLYGNYDGDKIISNTAVGNTTTSTIRVGSGNDTVYNTSDYVSISAGNGNNSITNAGNFVTIDSGSGEDTITNSGSNVTINSGFGNDSINNTGTNTTYIFSYQDGNDTITGFNQDTDLIWLDAYTIYYGSEIVNGNFVISVRNSSSSQTTASITLDGVSSGSVRYKIGDGDIQTLTIA